MSLVTYEPLNLLNRFHDELLRGRGWPAFQGAEASNIVTSQWIPAVDLKEEADHYILIADVPGVDPKNIEVTMENGMLTIKGERKSEVTEEKEDYSRVERSCGSFYRRFSLPDTADVEKIRAESKDGVLRLTIPKREAVKARKIEVKS